MTSPHDSIGLPVRTAFLSGDLGGINVSIIFSIHGVSGVLKISISRKESKNMTRSSKRSTCRTKEELCQWFQMQDMFCFQCRDLG